MYIVLRPPISSCFLSFFFNDPATTEIYTLSLHDALPIYLRSTIDRTGRLAGRLQGFGSAHGVPRCSDRKSTRLNSSHVEISYAVFCLKKKRTALNSLCARSSAGR